MYDFVNRIISDDTLNSKQKIDRINEYRSQLDYAEKIVLGEYKYNDKCDDYYLKESEPCKICTCADQLIAAEKNARMKLQKLVIKYAQKDVKQFLIGANI